MIFRAIAYAIVAAIGGTLGFWTVDREPPVVILSAGVVSEPIRPGEDLHIKYFVKRLRSCRTKLDRFLFDGDNQRVLLDGISFSGAPGPLGESTYVTTIPIPRRFAPGEGRYRVVLAYVCNPLQAIWPVVTENPEITFAVSGAPLPTDQLPVETLPRR